eukprot:TRINITY_DN3132_c0_g1_i1.p1 TRINITY_DN3132_c0_g1~~TRINITY_DN3132_c0_g1_i1.p1  ORF type:complete len:526 (+),score=145.44 TRINITY_DN3132_c0_g1_i1:72-1649(+)
MEIKKVFGNKEFQHVQKKVVQQPPKKYSFEDTWEKEQFFYTKVLNSIPDPLITFFFNLTLDMDRVIERYKHIYPDIKRKELKNILTTEPSHYRWSGCDLFYTTEATYGGRKMVVIETNSCPSGQKSFPLMKDQDEKGGYGKIMKHTFKPWLEQMKLQGKVPDGVLAVIYDKNKMEASGYALSMAQVFHESVFLVEILDQGGVGKEYKYVRWANNNRILQIRTSNEGEWINVRAAFRYVTQKPWNRMPIPGDKEVDLPRTQFINPIVVDIAGGRNKLVAAKAYEFFNSRYKGNGLTVRVPETINDVEKPEIPLWVNKFGGQAVIKVPYSNAGQGVYTILTETELESFMNGSGSKYNNYIIQQCIGNSSWSSKSLLSDNERYFHVGTVPSKKGNIYVADLRVMISFDFKRKCYRPLALYARRAKEPLSNNITEDCDSWQMLGTNLSFKTENGEWDTDTKRLLLMDQKDFNTLGIGVDDLIDAFLQTVMATVAIDQLASKLQPEDKPFNFELLSSLNNDQAFLDEIFK